MLKLIDFLLACKVPLNLSSYKIHLATHDTNSPLDAFFAGKFKEWQEYQTKKNFSREMVVALIQLSRAKWLFAGVYKILGCTEHPEHYSYVTELLPGQNELIGRIIVEHERKFRNAYLIGNTEAGDFKILEIKEKQLSVEEFPGFNAVCIPFTKLQFIIEQQIQSWYGALSNIKGIYLIADKAAGKLYVGSATGNSGIWQRWSEYVVSGHGGNKELKGLLKDKPREYWCNFQYSILEIADSHASDEYILQRECYWKEVLLSRIYGYNSN